MNAGAARCVKGHRLFRVASGGTPGLHVYFAKPADGLPTSGRRGNAFSRSGTPCRIRLARRRTLTGAR